MSMVNRERKIVEVKQAFLDLDNNTLGEALDLIEELIGVYGKAAFIRSKTEDYSESDREYMYVYTEEPESDEAMVKRIAYEERYAKEYEDREIEQYNRLQAKYGSKQTRKLK